MNRAVMTTNYGEDKVRHTVRIEGDPAPESGQPSFAALVNMLQSLCYQPDLLRHGGDCPEMLRAYYAGGRWVVETSTVAQRKS